MDDVKSGATSAAVRSSGEFPDKVTQTSNNPLSNVIHWNVLHIKRPSKMPVYHIVLFKLKSGVNKEQLDNFAATARSMVGKIPGLLDFQVGPGLAVTAHRAKGYDMGLVATLEKVEDVTSYGLHPAHQETHRLREDLCDETLAFDFEFSG